MSPICRPVHGIYLGQMAFEVAPWLHSYPWQLLCVVLCHLLDYKSRHWSVLAQTVARLVEGQIASDSAILTTCVG
jgi:hypothetical protein